MTHVGEGDGGDAAVVGQLGVGGGLPGGVVEGEDRLPLAAARGRVAEGQGRERLDQALGLGRPRCSTQGTGTSGAGTRRPVSCLQRRGSWLCRQ